MSSQKNKRRLSGALLLSALLFAGSTAVGAGSIRTFAAEAAVVRQETEEKDYILGRPMTEEEKEEQRELIRKYTSNLQPIDLSTYENRPKLPLSDQTSGEVSVKNTILPAAYDSREKGIVPPIRDQSPYGTCWAHAATALAEISMLKTGMTTMEETDLSEMHLAFFTFRSVTDPLGGLEGDTIYKDRTALLNGGSNIATAMIGLSAWKGVVPEAVMPYQPNTPDPEETIEMAYGHTSAIVENYTEVDHNQDAIKQAIMDRGAVGLIYYAPEEGDGEEDYFNEETAAQYCNTAIGQNHSTVIVGWDDYYNRNNFVIQPESNGAWLVRNSWGDWFGDGGYFWLSYEDATIWSSFSTLTMTEREQFDNNYQYDGALGGCYIYGYETLSAANVFTVHGNGTKDEALDAVAFETYDDTEYSIQIYRNPKDPSIPDSGTPMLEQPIEGRAEYKGYYTVYLEEPVYLEAGDQFAVEVTVTDSKNYVFLMGERDVEGVSTASVKQGQSFVKRNNKWYDVVQPELREETGIDISGNVRIKAFTRNLDVEAVQISGAEGMLKVGETRQLGAEVLPAGVENSSVLWSSTDPEIAQVDDQGLVRARKTGTVEIWAVSAENPNKKDVYILTVDEDPVIQEVTASAVTGSSAVLTVLVQPGRGSAIEEYQLESLGQEAGIRISQTEPGVFAVSGLKPLTQYRFQACVYNSSRLSARKEVTIETGRQAGPAAPQISGSFQAEDADGWSYSYTLQAVEGAEYRMDDGDWQESNVFRGLQPGSSHEFFIRIKETADREAGEAGSTGILRTPDMLRTVEEIFEDVEKGTWYYDSIAYVYKKSIMTGMGNSSLFMPHRDTTRAMVVKILHNMEGGVAVDGEDVFWDVMPTAYYGMSVKWALKHGITTGISDTEFAPERTVARQEVASFLYRYAKYKGYDITARKDISHYQDYGKVSAYAREAMEWANATGILTGKGGILLDPLGKATRAEIATMVYRLLAAAGQE